MDIYRACYLGNIQESDNGKSTSLALAGLCRDSEKIYHKVTRGLRISIGGWQSEDFRCSSMRTESCCASSKPLLGENPAFPKMSAHQDQQQCVFFFLLNHTKRSQDGCRSARGVKLLQLKRSCNVSGDTEVTLPDVYNRSVPRRSLQDNSDLLQLDEESSSIQASWKSIK